MRRNVDRGAGDRDPFVHFGRIGLISSAGTALRLVPLGLSAGMFFLLLPRLFESLSDRFVVLDVKRSMVWAFNGLGVQWFER